MSHLQLPHGWATIDGSDRKMIVVATTMATSKLRSHQGIRRGCISSSSLRNSSRSFRLGIGGRVRPRAAPEHRPIRVYNRAQSLQAALLLAARAPRWPLCVEHPMYAHLPLGAQHLRNPARYGKSHVHLQQPYAPLCAQLLSCCAQCYGEHRVDWLPPRPSRTALGARPVVRPLCDPLPRPYGLVFGGHTQALTRQPRASGNKRKPRLQAGAKGPQAVRLPTARSLYPAHRNPSCLPPLPGTIPR
jgi:hypothetical protein